jgi:hypothetical protein
MARKYQDRSSLVASLSREGSVLSLLPKITVTMSASQRALPICEAFARATNCNDKHFISFASWMVIGFIKANQKLLAKCTLQPELMALNSALRILLQQSRILCVRSIKRFDRYRLIFRTAIQHTVPVFTKHELSTRYLPFSEWDR